MNLANLAHFSGKWAGLAVLSSWLVQNSLQDFDFFNCHGCQTFILAKIHWAPSFFMHNNSSIATVNQRSMDNCFLICKDKSCQNSSFSPTQIFCQNHAAEKLTKIRFLPDEQPVTQAFHIYQQQQSRRPSIFEMHQY